MNRASSLVEPVPSEQLILGRLSRPLRLRVCPTIATGSRHRNRRDHAHSVRHRKLVDDAIHVTLILRLPE
jgi:hypothetical protein